MSTMMPLTILLNVLLQAAHVQAKNPDQSIVEVSFVPMAGSFADQLNPLHDDEEDEERRLQRFLQAASSPGYVRPIVKSLSNGGHLAIKLNEAVEFPSDMMTQLNTKKEEMIVMQVNPEKTIPEPIPANGREKLPDIVKWEALSVKERILTFRLLFDDASKISSEEGKVDTLCVTLDLAAFKSVDGKYIPDGSQIKRNLPAQMPVDTAETYETVGNVASWIFLALMGINGSLNTMFESLDYQALMDAIEGTQLITFIPAMDVKLPPNVNELLASLKEASTVEPSDHLRPEGKPSMADNVFGEQPETQPLNDRVATLGYNDMTPAAEIGTVSVMFGMQVGGALIFFFSYFCHKKTGSMLAERFQMNMQQFVLWGTLINIIMINYMPVLISTFISVVGMQWEVDTSEATANNLWTIFMLNSWLICPPLMYILLYRNRQQIGQMKEGAVPARDPAKLKWKRDWTKYKEIAETAGKNPYGLIALCKEKRAAKNSAQKVNPQQQLQPLQAEEEKGIELSQQVAVYEGGQAIIEERQSLIQPNNDDKVVDAENPQNDQRPKKNAWKLFGKQLPACLVPRKRNNETTRANEKQAVDVGVDEGDHTKEHMWAGPVDRDYGEFYKKMSLQEKKIATEGIIFYNFWNMYRKLIYAITIVFFNGTFRVQAYTQMVLSGVMLGYVINYWPCARYVDNVSKVINELTFMIMLVNCAYLKEMSNGVSNFDPGTSPASAGQGAGDFMVFVTSASMVYHAARMTHNSVQAAKTIKQRRQAIASKWMGPPTHNDPNYSNDTSSGEEQEPEKEIEKEKEDDIVDDSPDLALLAIPESEPAEAKPRSELEIFFPQELFDAMVAMPKVLPEPDIVPKPEETESETDTVEVGVKPDLDIDIEMPQIFGTHIEEPTYPLEENSWPKPDLEYIPEQPGQSNDLGIEMPQIPGGVPGEPQIGQDKIIDQGDDHIILEYEIEFPKPRPLDEKPALPGSGRCCDMPKLPDFELAAPDIQRDHIEFPPMIPERVRIPQWPKTIYDTGKLTLGKPPKPLKPKPFQKILNTIPMPMRIKNVPFKPVGQRRGQQPKGNEISPERKPVLPIVEPAYENGIPIPVRKPEKNQIALQQLSLADNQRYERVILGDVDHNTENLLNTLKDEGRIQAFKFQGTPDDPQAEVILNGGLVNMTKFARSKKKQEEQHGLSRMTNQLLHEQMARLNYMTTKGVERVSSASPDSRSPARQSNNYVGNGLNPNASNPSADFNSRFGDEGGPSNQKTFNQMHSPILKAGEQDDVVNRDASPRVNLDPIVNASRQRQHDQQIAELQQQQQQQQWQQQDSASRPNSQGRPQINSDANQSPLNSVEKPASRHSKGSPSRM